MTKKQIDQVVKEMNKFKGLCKHAHYIDCTRCLARWVRRAIKKAIAEGKV